MCRRACIVIASIVALVSAPVAAHASASSGVQLVVATSTPQPDTPSPCTAPAIICAGRQVVGTVIDAAGDAASAGASTAANEAMSGVVAWAADGAAWLVEAISEQIEKSTRPELDQAWFAERYSGMVSLAVALAAIFLLLAVGQAIIAQDIARLLRATFVLLPCALLLTFAAVTLTQIALRITDAMTAWILNGTGEDMHRAFHGLSAVLAAPAGPTAPFVMFLNAILISVFALVVWLELVLREAAVYVALAFLPLTLVAMVWEQTAHWSRRLAEWLLAIVLAKFTIAAAFALAAAAVGEGLGQGGGVSTVLAGSAVLLIAGLTPWALLKLLPFAEAAATHSLTRNHVTGAVMGAPGAQTATSVARQLAMTNFAAGAAGGMAPALAAAASTPPPNSGGPPSDSPQQPDLPELPARRPARARPEGPSR